MVGFCPILSIFYTVFHPTEGSKVLCQVPSGSVVSPSEKEDSSSLSTPFFNFDWVKNYVIPKPALCNHLVTCKVGQCRIVGFPVHIYGSEYERNSFIFNFAFVFSADSESTVYEMPIRRLARMFMALEEQSRFLSKSPSLTTISSIIEQIYQDLNNYSECMIPIDDSNTVNMKLFPLVPAPPELKPYHVPISTVQLERLMDENWDPTMEKIIPYVNGINCIRQIAELADADYSLTNQCIQHLVHYKCLVIVDLFQFSNIYAPTSDVSLFLADPDMYKECQAYVCYPSEQQGRNRLASQGSSHFSGSQIHEPTSFSSSSSFSTYRGGGTTGGRLPSQATLFWLYKSLHQGQSVREWCIEHRKLLQGIDVRRFISFGIIKGLLYRVHSYPIYEKRTRHHHAHHHKEAPKESEEIEHMLYRIMHRPKHFDSICTSLKLPKKDVEAILQKKGDWTVVSA